MSKTSLILTRAELLHTQLLELVRAEHQHRLPASLELQLNSGIGTTVTLNS
jgi:hypothetical protein